MFRELINVKINSNPFSDRTFARIQGWIEEFERCHSLCKGSEISTLPTRVLDVGSEVGHQAVKLVETDGISDNSLLSVTV
jgi:hypothetical protein